MQAGDMVRTPRFCTVIIEEMFDNETQLREAGYTEPTHFWSNNYVVLGKSLDKFHMTFGTAKKQKNNENE